MKGSVCDLGVETCKLLAISPNAYLADLLARIVTRRDGDPLEDLLPGNWVDTKAAEPKFKTSNIAQAAWAKIASKAITTK